MASHNDRFGNLTDHKCFQPSADHLPKRTQEYVRRDFTKKYLELLENRSPTEVVSYLKRNLGNYDISIGKVSDKPFFVSDEDVGIAGASGNAFAFVKPGKKNGGLRLLISHVDVPCLKVNVNPVYIDPDAEMIMFYPSFGLSTTPFGGIRPSDWLGQQVDVLGNIYLNGKKKAINIPGVIKARSVHVEDGVDDKTFLLEHLKVDLGTRSLKETYKLFGVKDSMDFGRADLYVYPHFSGGKNGRLIGNELAAFGQDDRLGVYSSVAAGLDSIFSDSENTMVILGLDREEVGSKGASAGYEGFTKIILQEAMNRAGKKNIDLESELNRSLFKKYPALVVDGDVALGGLDMSQEGVNPRTACKAGWGFFMSGFDTEFGQRKTSVKHLAALTELFEDSLPLSKKKDRFQPVGECNSVDSPKSNATMADAFGSTFPCVDIGIGIIGTHHPRSECANVFDLYWLKEGLSTYLRAKE